MSTFKSKRREQQARNAPQRNRKIKPAAMRRVRAKNRLFIRVRAHAQSIQTRMISA